MVAYSTIHKMFEMEENQIKYVSNISFEDSVGQNMWQIDGKLKKLSNILKWCIWAKYNNLQHGITCW